MKQIIIAAILIITSVTAHSSCYSVAADATTIAEFRDAGNTPEQTKSVLAQANPRAADDRQWESLITDKVYETKVKPWNAIQLANSICPHSTNTAANEGKIIQKPNCPYGARDLGGPYECLKSPEQIAADEAEAEKQREASYRASFHRIQRIPGVCVGDACKGIKKIQQWDPRTGQMLN